MNASSRRMHQARMPSARIVSPAVLALAVCLPAALALTGCATTESAYRAAPAPAPVADTGDLPRFVNDDAYTAYVERQAASRGISVHWVNKRQKRLLPGQTDSEAR